MSDTPDQAIAKSAFAQYKAHNYPKLSDEDGFERFASALVLKPFAPDPLSIEQGLVAGTNDGGIDGFFIFINSREPVESDSIRLTNRKARLEGLQPGFTLDIVIVQAKKEQNWDTNVFSKIGSAFDAIFDEKFDLREFPLNADVVEKAEVLRKLRRKVAHLAPQLRFHVSYVALAPQANVDTYMLTKARQLEETLANHLPSDCETFVAYLGDTEVVRLHRQTTDFTATLELAKSPIREGTALVALVKVSDYLTFLTDDSATVLREEMFAGNVRDYAGSNLQVNDAIGKTLATDSPSKFWWLNNGITIIADDKKDPYDTTWVLTNPLIVNGLQSSHVLHEQSLSQAITKNRREESLLVRVIVDSNREVREAIIRGTNNQTAISSLQLHANEDAQIRIEGFLRAKGWYYERRKYQHRGTDAPAGKVKSYTELAQAVMAFRLLQPDTARARPGSLLGTPTGWDTVFVPGRSEEIYLRALNALEQVESYLYTAEAKKISDNRTNTRFYLLSGLALRGTKVKSLDDFHKLPDSALKASGGDTELSSLHKLLVKQATLLDDGKVPQDQIFKGTNLKSMFFKKILLLNKSG